MNITTDPGTADLLLFANPREAMATLAQAVEGRRLLENYGHLGGLGDRVVSAGGELLQGVDLGSVLLSGWLKYQALREAAHRTLAHPGSGELVRLAGHKIVSKHAPYLEVFVDGKRLVRVVFGIDLEFDITLLQASVRAGRLVRLSAGDCTAGVSWSIEGFEVARKSAPIRMPFHLSLGEGIPLVRKIS